MIKNDEKSPHVILATMAIDAYVKEMHIIEPPSELSAHLRGQAGVFVSLKKYGELRGCIGTVEPTRKTIADEIVYNAISAAIRDPRFLPVEVDELELLTCSVDVLSPPEPIDDICMLHPIDYGVVVECGNRRGLLLPNLEGVDTVEQQIDIACRKAMIRKNESIKLYRFQVKRFH